MLSGKQPWSEVQEDVAVVLRLANGDRPSRPASRVIDDSHWNFIQDCWSSVDEQPTAKVMISAIQRFLSHCPQSPLLCDLLRSSLIHADSLVDKFSSSLRQATTEDPGRNLELLVRDKRYQLHGYLVRSIMLTIWILPAHRGHIMRFLKGEYFCKPVISTRIEHERRLAQPSPLSSGLSNTSGFLPGTGSLPTFEGKSFSIPAIPSAYW